MCFFCLFLFYLPTFKRIKISQRSREAVSRQAAEEDSGLDQGQEGAEEAAGQGRQVRQQVHRTEEENKILILKSILSFWPQNKKNNKSLLKTTSF